MKKPELLAPAGSSEALEAAIEGGADAVYLGLSAYGARAYAKNFSHDEFKEAAAPPTNIPSLQTSLHIAPAAAKFPHANTPLLAFALYQ